MKITHVKNWRENDNKQTIAEIKKIWQKKQTAGKTPKNEQRIVTNPVFGKLDFSVFGDKRGKNQKWFELAAKQKVIYFVDENHKENGDYYDLLAITKDNGYLALPVPVVRLIMGMGKAPAEELVNTLWYRGFKFETKEIQSRNIFSRVRMREKEKKEAEELLKKARIFSCHKGCKWLDAKGEQQRCAGKNFIAEAGDKIFREASESSEKTYFWQKMPKNFKCGFFLRLLRKNASLCGKVLLLPNGRRIVYGQTMEGYNPYGMFLVKEVDRNGSIKNASLVDIPEPGTSKVFLEESLVVPTSLEKLLLKGVKIVEDIPDEEYSVFEVPFDRVNGSGVAIETDGTVEKISFSSDFNANYADGTGAIHKGEVWEQKISVTSANWIVKRRWWNGGDRYSQRAKVKHSWVKKETLEGRITKAFEKFIEVI